MLDAGREREREDGGGAVVSAMVASKLMGAQSATVLAYANSGDITGERRGQPYIVGYTAAAFIRPAAS